MELEERFRKTTTKQKNSPSVSAEVKLAFVTHNTTSDWMVPNTQLVFIFGPCQWAFLAGRWLSSKRWPGAPGFFYLVAPLFSTGVLEDYGVCLHQSTEGSKEDWNFHVGAVGQPIMATRIPWLGLPYGTAPSERVGKVECVFMNQGRGLLIFLQPSLCQVCLIHVFC